MPEQPVPARPVRPARPGARPELYLGTEVDSPVRHLSLVPHVPGLTALCGQVLTATIPYPRREVSDATVSCPACLALIEGSA